MHLTHVTVNAATARKLDIAYLPLHKLLGDILIRNLSILTFKQLKRCKCKHDFMNIVKITEFDNLSSLSNTFILQRPLLVELWLIIIVVRKSGCISKGIVDQTINVRHCCVVFMSDRRIITLKN